MNVIRLEDLAGSGRYAWLERPMGVFEFDAFVRGNDTLARALAASDVLGIAGSGDTLAAMAQYGIEEDVGHVSTGRDAVLEALEGRTSPASQILAQRTQP